MLRRRPDPALAKAHEAFLRCAEQVDLGQRAMLRCVPSSARSLALPPAVGAETLRLSLADARAVMDDWYDPAVAPQWDACRSAIAETLGLLDETLERLVATDELEVALAAVQRLLDPLHAFVDAEEAFRRAR